MTKSTNPPPTPEPQNDRGRSRLWQKLKSNPKKVAGGIAAITAVGSLGYWGIQVLVKRNLPPFLENQIGKIIERPIDLGEVKSFSLTGIEFGQTVIPQTATDADKVTVEGVKVGFNIFPVLFRRTLPLDVALVQPNVYLEQEQDGEWINLDFLKPDPSKPDQDPLVYFDVDLDLEQAEITAVPYQQNPLQAKVDGSGRFEQKNAVAEYDLDATIEQATAKIQGSTKLETGSTDTKLLVENLALADAATLLPIPVTVDGGILNADLDIDIPSLTEITAANIQGKVNLQNLQGEATDLNAPITAESQLNFSGRNGEVKNTQATLGDITAQVDGQVNLDTGYDLNVNVLPFQLASIPEQLIQQLPVDVAGEVEAQVKLRGEIQDPQVTGNINNTQTVRVDQTALKKINADFQGNLEQVVLQEVEIIPLAGGQVTATGTVTTNLRQAFDNKQPLDVTQMPVALSFDADLPTAELINPYYQLPAQVAVGELQAQGDIEGTLADPQGLVTWNIADSGKGSTEDIAGAGELVIANQKLMLRDTEITYGEGKVDVTADASLKTKEWQASLDGNQLNLRPFATQFSNPNVNLDHPLGINTLQAEFKGNLEQLSLEQIQGVADLNLNVNGGNVTVDSQLDSGNLQATTTTNQIPLTPFIPSLLVPASLQSGTITASAKISEILALQDNPQLKSLQADADLDLVVDGEAVAVNSQINSGQIQAQANTSQINLNRLAPNLPLPANLNSSQLTASGNLEQLLNFAENPNLNTFDARVDADLTVAAGTVQAIANLNNNQWQANVDADNISSSLLIEKFAPSNLANVQVDNLNAQANLTGSILPLINNEVNLPITVNQVAVNSGAQNLTAQGDLTLANITSNLDVADSNLDINANIDFASLPIDQLVAGATQNNDLISKSVNLEGKAVFNGQFQGQNILSTSTENVSLTGNLSLNDLAFNQITFDPVMQGQLTLQPQQEIALNLAGEQDVIAARAVPCNTNDCTLPYLPTSLELRQGENTNQPVIAVGERTGDRFAVDINNFPLALLNLAPGTAAGIEGALNGTTTGAIDLDLYSLAATGNIQVAQPGVGYIQADQLNANFNYDPDQNIAEISSASLELDRSKYDLNAALDLVTGQIDGKLAIPEAYIQDVLTTLRWFSIKDALRLFNIPDYGATSSVKPTSPQDTTGESIARRLNQLRQVNRQIQANAAAKDVGNIPTELDIKGKYTGEIILGGTIQTPEANFRVEGNNWQWQASPAYPDIVNPLGLVIEESQFIALPQVLIAGDLQGTTVDLEEARLELQEAIFALKGELSAEQSDAEFTVANLTVDNIRNFIEIPVDLAGEINSTGTIKGTLAQPQLAGSVDFADGSFNGNVLPEKLAGDFSYDGRQLDFQTTAPESIQVEANLPYPIVPEQSDRFTAKANLESEAFVFLAALSQNYLNWAEGEGDVELEASARLDLDREGVIYDLVAKGVVNLNDASVTVDTPFFTETFNGTGKITLNNQIVNVETLDATFAKKDLSVTGKLPILTAVSGLENPLTVNLPPGEIDIKQLYRGGVQGQVTVTGASLQPVIGGEVTLEDGRVSIPKTEAPTPENVAKIGKSQVLSQASGAKANHKATGKSSSANSSSTSLVTALDDFQVNLQKFKLQQAPLYDFQLEGGLLLNGTVDEPSNILPQGTLTLTKADVDLFSNEFNLVRNRENTIVFNPQAGVFNPQLDIILRTSVENLADGEVADIVSVESNSNEINDPITNNDGSQTIRISLVVDGEAEEILPNLGQAAITDCSIRPNNRPLVQNQRNYTQEELDQYTRCFADSFSLSASDRNLIESSVVTLTSTPSLDRGEIVSLLSNQFVNFARDVSRSSQSELFDLGVERFVIAPLLDSSLDRVEDFTVGVGRRIDLDYLTIYPDLEGIYELNQDSSLRFVFTHNLFDEIIEAINDSGNEETSSSQEVRLEFQRNF